MEEAGLFQKESTEEGISLELETICMANLNLEDEVGTIAANKAEADFTSFKVCESSSPKELSSENEPSVIKTENNKEEESSDFISTSICEVLENWTTSQLQAQNQSQGVAYSFPWSEVVGDSQRINNDLLSLLDNNIGLFSGNNETNTTPKTSPINEETAVKDPGPDLNSCSQSVSENSATDSNSQLTDDGLGEVYNYVYVTFPSYAQSNSTSTVTKTTQAIPVALPQTKVECLETGCSTPSSSAQLFPVPAFALPMNEPLTTEQLEKKEKVTRRREKNKECSRQFRIKQKQKLAALKEGKLQKEKLLIALHRRIELKARNLQSIYKLGCEKSREIIQSSQVEEMKENLRASRQ